MMPLTFLTLSRYPHLRPYCGPTGLVISVASIVLSSYATAVWQLIATQGVLNALGSGMLFAPTSLYLDEWFIQRKGLAVGIMWAGKSATGVAMPFIMSSLLTSYGTRTTLQAWTIALAVLTTPLLFMLKPRLPLPPRTAMRGRSINWMFLRNSTFWTLQIGNIIQSFGYFLPSTYLSSFAHDQG